MSEHINTDGHISAGKDAAASLRALAAKLPGVKDNLSNALDDLLKAYSNCSEGMGIARRGCEEAILDLKYILTGIGESLAWMTQILNEAADREAAFAAIHGEDTGSGSSAGATPSSGMGGQSMGMNPTIQEGFMRCKPAASPGRQDDLKKRTVCQSGRETRRREGK